MELGIASSCFRPYQIPILQKQLQLEQKPVLWYLKKTRTQRILAPWLPNCFCQHSFHGRLQVCKFFLYPCLKLPLLSNQLFLPAAQLSQLFFSFRNAVLHDRFHWAQFLLQWRDCYRCLLLLLFQQLPTCNEPDFPLQISWAAQCCFDSSSNCCVCFAWLVFCSSIREIMEAKCCFSSCCLTALLIVIPVSVCIPLLTPMLQFNIRAADSLMDRNLTTVIGLQRMTIIHKKGLL